MFKHTQPKGCVIIMCFTVSVIKNVHDTPPNGTFWSSTLYFRVILGLSSTSPPPKSGQRSKKLFFSDFFKRLPKSPEKQFGLPNTPDGDQNQFSPEFSCKVMVVVESLFVILERFWACRLLHYPQNKAKCQKRFKLFSDFFKHLPKSSEKNFGLPNTPPDGDQNQFFVNFHAK